jgi:hypothetical protein
MAVKVTTYKVVDLRLSLLVQVLELMSGGEFLHVQSVGEHTVRFPHEKMLALVCGNVRDGSKDLGRVGSAALDAISVVDAALSCLSIHIEVLQVIVKVDGPRAKVSAEESGVGGEDGGHVNATPLAERHGDASKPLVELGDDCALLIVEYVLAKC